MSDMNLLNRIVEMHCTRPNLLFYIGKEDEYEKALNEWAIKIAPIKKDLAMRRIKRQAYF